jgi:hypothetical protein
MPEVALRPLPPLPTPEVRVRPATARRRAPWMGARDGPGARERGGWGRVTPHTCR